MVYDTDEMLTGLCERVQKEFDYGSSLIEYTLISDDPTLAEWWANRQEQLRNGKEKLKLYALSKLTPNEREALGFARVLDNTLDPF